MGGGLSHIQYAVPISEKIKGETQVYRAPEFKNGLTDGLSDKIKDVKTAFLRSCKIYADKNCLGTIVRQEGAQQTIKFITYKDFYQQSVNVGSGIINLGLSFNPEGENLTFIGIFSKNRAEWSILDFGCILYKITTIPLYDTLGDQNISYVFNHTKLTTVFVNDASLRALMKCNDLVNVKNIVCFDKFNQKQQKYFLGKQIKLIPYQDVVKSGKQNRIDYKNEIYKVVPNDCITFCYTSGTTGPPKGAMLSHKNYCSFLGIIKTNKDVKLTQNDVVLSYLPLPHVLQRQLLYGLLALGSTIVYYSGDVQKIKDDLNLAKPTIFVSVPRLFSRFYDALRKKIDNQTGFKRKLIDYGLAKKLDNVTRFGNCTHMVYDQFVFNKTKSALGGNVRLMISGSAPLLPHVHKYMKVTMTVPLLEGYGQTQSTGASFITAAQDPQVGHVGGPVSNIEYKLVDIPQMQYTSQDTDINGNKAPRGQIWLRGPGVFLGYYKNQQKTKQTLTQDGWLKTGDVGVILANNKGLKIIDRKKNIFKLAQGQYVAAEKVENFYYNCPLASEIFLHGESTENYAIVFVTPVRAKLEQMAKNLQISGTFQQLCVNQKIRIQVLKQLNQVGKKKGLKSFELAKNIYLQPVGFQSKQILTTTMKIQRHEAKKVYEKEIQNMYKQGMLGKKNEQ